MPSNFWQWEEPKKEERKLKYVPRFSNVEEIFEDVVSSLKEATEYEAEAAAKFAKYLDGFIYDIINEEMEPLLVHLDWNNRGELVFSIHTDQLASAQWQTARDTSLTREESLKEQNKYDGKDFDFWELLEDACDKWEIWEDYPERARASAAKFRALADKLDAQAEESENE